MRPGEAWRLKWIDIDFVKKGVNITPEKGSNSGAPTVSDKLLAMLQRLPRKSDHVFKSGSLKHFAGGFRKQRRRIAAKLSNPRLNRISFKTFRPFKGTIEYHRTKDLLHVLRVLRHKNIKNTMVYTHLVDFESDEFVSKVANTSRDACELIETGFDYVVTTPDKPMIFRKRK